jgi:hypothetical protein
VSEGIKWVDSVGRLRGLWPSRAMEREERMDLVLSQ